MKKISIIIRWILGIFIVLLGVASFFDSILGSALWTLSGILVIPSVSEKISFFKDRKMPLVVCCLGLIFIGSFFMPETGTDSGDSTVNAQEDAENAVENTETNVQDTVPEVKPEEPKESDTSGDNPDTQSTAFETDKLAAWIKEKIEGTDPSISRKERKEWKDIAEADFTPVWKSVLASAIDDCCSIWVNLEGAEKILSNSIALYVDMYGNDANVSDISNLSNELNSYLESNKNLNEKYSFDLGSSYSSYTQDEFYITQRLEKGYSDNILGILQKEADSYKPETASDWVAYNVDYVLGTATPGDTCSVVHSDNLNPFPESGAYNITYVDTGTTMDLTNTKGFTQTVPVYQMIEDVATLEADGIKYNKNNNNAIGCYERLRQVIG